MRIDLPEPTRKLVESKISEFELDNVAVERGLTQLIACFPKNEDLGHVLVKVAAINALYSTQIRGVYQVAGLIESYRIDPLLETGSVDAVRSIEKVIYGEKSRSIYSFATKYCSWHQPELYPIYDRMVDFCLETYRDQYHFCDFDFDYYGLRDYGKLREVVDAFRRTFNLESLSYKQLDKFFYLLGGKYSPSTRSASAPVDGGATTVGTRQIVLEVGAEGGSITLWREKTEDGWQFQVKTNEAILYDEELDITQYQSISLPAQSLDEALELLDRYRWTELIPIQIYPEYMQQILAAVEKKNGLAGVARWKDRIAK